MDIIKSIQNFYGKFERPISSISLVGGFIFDIFALKRLDLFWENFWIVVHLLIVAVFIVLVNMKDNEGSDDSDPSKLYFWYINVLQFFFGGLLSTFLVFYFRSATLSVTWPFLLILLGAFIANERLKRHYSRLTFQISLLFLSLLSYLAFIVPVFFHRIGMDVFITSGVLSLIILGIFVQILKFISNEKFKKSRRKLIASVLGIFLLTNVLYYYNLIPPIPISLKDAGIYHSITRDASYNYDVTSEDVGFFGFFTIEPTVHIIPGDSIFAYNAIFLPDFFNINLIHEWQKYNSDTGNWETVDQINLFAVGGRDGGYRTYSEEKNITPGEWRVNVITSDGQIIGRMQFFVETVNIEPTLIIEIKD